jgi:ATP dependent DNA ligase domain
LGFIQPSRPALSKKPPTGELWVHEVKHDGYRLQVHVRAGRVRLFTMNAADWTERYPLIVEAAARLKRDASSIVRSSALTNTVAPISTGCTAGASSTKRLPALSISCGWMGTTCGGCHFRSVRANWKSCCAGLGMASSMSSTWKAMAIMYSRPPASSGWKAS